ncbi:MAG: hypothetical protein K8T25_23475 [Planctomycetia bacterium]|nr:hypothetical protein [Planctomycetia bacterium]
MSARSLLASLAFVPLCGACLAAAQLATAESAAAQEVRYYQDGGVTYREVRQLVPRSVVETRMEQRQQTVYKQQYTTQTVPTTQTVYTPVTEYRWEPRWHNTWNPFSEPYVAYQLVPSTRWETRTQQVQQTVTKTDIVPQTQTVQVPVTTQRVVNEEFISRTAVQGPAPVLGAVPAAGGYPAAGVYPAALPASSQPQPIGGISKLGNDPPRDGGTWRSGQPSVSR